MGYDENKQCTSATFQVGILCQGVYLPPRNWLVCRTCALESVATTRFLANIVTPSLSASETASYQPPTMSFFGIAQSLSKDADGFNQLLGNIDRKNIYSFVGNDALNSQTSVLNF